MTTIAPTTSPADKRWPITDTTHSTVTAFNFPIGVPASHALGGIATNMVPVVQTAGAMLTPDVAHGVTVYSLPNS